MLSVPCGYWSLFIDTFRGSDFERSASQNRTISTVVTAIVEKERFFWSCTIKRQKTTSNSVSFLLLTPKAYSQSLITFTSILVLSRNRAAWVTKRLSRQPNVRSLAGFSRIIVRCSIHACGVPWLSLPQLYEPCWCENTGQEIGPGSTERNQHRAQWNTRSLNALNTAWPTIVYLNLKCLLKKFFKCQNMFRWSIMPEF